MIYFDTFKKLPQNVGELGKLIVAKGFEKLPKVQKIAQSGHTGQQARLQGKDLMEVGRAKNEK